MELQEIKGIGPKTIELLNKLSIFTIDDLIRYYPYRYNVYTPKNINAIEEEEIAVITGTVASSAKIAYIKRNFNKLSFILETKENRCNVVIFNRPFLSRNLFIGKKITLIGKFNRIKNLFTANDIKLYPILKTELEPIYHKISGLKSSTLIKAIHNAIDLRNNVPEIIPAYLSNQYELLDTYSSIKEIHSPTDLNRLKKAKLKLKYEELFEFMFKINMMKFKNEIFSEFVMKDINDKVVNKIITSIPFTLTEDQRSAVKDILEDFRNPKRMNRLILGDVGSGKTIVSFIAILLNKEAGYQSALLAPTEVLANQHYKNIQDLQFNLKVELLTSSSSKKEKEAIIDKLREGEIDVLIGTHAILEEYVEFQNIGLVITDEQHRFGVNQRKALQNKGRAVDVLYMSATPIPRTYALTIYGDMDISMIKQKPAGRKEIITTVNKFSEMKDIIKEIEKEIEKTHQIYVVAPLIENEESDLNDVNQIETLLKENLTSQVKIGILHGKMKQIEKDRVMNQFKEGNLDILVSTTVIEVGIDVKNATMMIIFNAERFGLATLHQLRGRVGRNELQSKCILISDKETERLKVLEESNDGFYISEKDFDIRGSGDLFGIKQSGDMDFKVANIRTDYKILLQCKKDSQDFINKNIENNFRNYEYFEKITYQILNIS